MLGGYSSFYLHSFFSFSIILSPFVFYRFLQLIISRPRGLTFLLPPRLPWRLALRAKRTLSTHLRSRLLFSSRPSSRNRIHSETQRPRRASAILYRVIPLLGYSVYCWTFTESLAFISETPDVHDDTIRASHRRAVSSFEYHDRYKISCLSQLDFWARYS
jgi:hypothetical protein